MRADVVVIGAGIIGCAAAHELARRGRKPLIVDDRPVGEGASHAAGGMLVPYVEAHERGPMLELGVRSLAMYDEFVSRVREDGVGTFEYTRAGSVQVAMDDERGAALRLDAATLHREGVEATWLDRPAVRALEPALAADVIGGLQIKHHGIVAAGALTLALARAARRLGGDFIAARTSRVARAGERVAVETDAGTIDTDTVVIAAGAWSPQIEVEGDPCLPVRPIRGQLMVLTWPGVPMSHIVWGPRCYLVPWSDGTLLAGATMEDVGFDEHATVAAVRDLLDAASEVVPEAWRATFRHARVGLRPASVDGLPIIGRSSALPQVVYATGHFRNGILLAPITAKFVADALEDATEDRLASVCSPARFAAPHSRPRDHQEHEGHQEHPGRSQ